MRMNRTKKITLIILGSAFVLLSALTLIISRTEEKKEAIRTSGELILSVDPDNVTSLSWEIDGEGLSFHKDIEWLWDDDEGYPVNEEPFAALLDPFTDLTASFVIESPDDLSQYGLSDPTGVIRLNDGTEREILLGDLSAMDSERYVSIGDGNVYLVTNDPLTPFNVDIDDFILNDSIPSGIVDATGITFEGAADYTIRVEEDSPLTYCAEDVFFTGDTPLDTDTVDAYLSVIKSLSPSSYVTYNASEEELKLYGMADPELTVTIDYSIAVTEEESVTLSFTLHVGRNQEELKEALENPDDNLSVSAYIRVGESQLIYPITESTYKKLMAVEIDDFRHCELFTGQFDELTSVDITLEGESYTLYTAEDEDGEKDENGERPLIWHFTEDDELSITKFETALYSLSAYSFDKAGVEKGREEIRLVLHQANENFPTVEIALYRVDGYTCLAELDGEFFGLVTRSYVVDLMEAVNEIVLN